MAGRKKCERRNPSPGRDREAVGFTEHTFDETQRRKENKPNEERRDVELHLAEGTGYRTAAFDTLLLSVFEVLNRCSSLGCLLKGIGR
jgi:hypothetical protein